MHIVICTHPMADLYIRDLVETFAGEPYLILEDYRQRILHDTDLTVLRINENNPLRYLSCVRNARSRIDTLEKRHDRLHVYVPHTSHLLSNYAAHLASKRSGATLSLIPDGTLNIRGYTRRRKHPRLLLKSIARIIAGLLCGFFYHPNIRSVIGAGSLSYASVYAILPEFTKAPPGAEIKSLAVRHRQEKLNESTLIIGQYGNNAHLPSYLSGIRRALTDRRIAGLPIHYRPHPSERLSPLLRDFLEDRGIKLDVSPHPVERDNHHAVILSFNSTALMTLKLIQPGVRCYAISQAGVCDWDRPEHANLRAAFESVGVEFID